MVAGAAVAGLLADRFGRRPVFQWSRVLWGVASYLCSTAHSVEALIGYRVLLGSGMGMEFPVAQALLSEFVPTASRGRLIALMDGFWPLCFITAGIATYLVLPGFGWRSVFALLAIQAGRVRRSEVHALYGLDLIGRHSRLPPCGMARSPWPHWLLQRWASRRKASRSKHWRSQRSLAPVLPAIPPCSTRRRKDQSANRVRFFDCERICNDDLSK